MEVLDLGVTRVPQEKCVTCGPAVARMVIGAGAPSECTLVKAIVKFASINPPNGCFLTSPEALSNALTGATGREFRVERRGTLAEVNRLIVNVLEDHRIAVPVVVEQCAHWIVASGMIYEENAGLVQVSTFIIDDPYNSCLDCIHETPITPCRDVSFVENVPAAEWRSKWLNGCDCPTSPSQFICVVPIEATDGPRQVKELVPEDPGPGLARSVDASDLSSLEESVRHADQLYGLSMHETFGSALEGASVLAAREVESQAGSYILTEVGKPAGVTARFLFTPGTGSLISARAFKEPVDTLVRPVDEGRQILHTWRIKNNVEAAIEEALTEGTQWRWEPTQEFGSRYFPFYTVGEGDARTYLGTNKAVYKNLHKARA